MTENFWQEFLDQQADLSGPTANVEEKNVQFFFIELLFVLGCNIWQNIAIYVFWHKKKGGDLQVWIISTQNHYFLICSTIKPKGKFSAISCNAQYSKLKILGATRQQPMSPPMHSKYQSFLFHIQACLQAHLQRLSLMFQKNLNCLLW